MPRFEPTFARRSLPASFAASLAALALPFVLAASASRTSVALWGRRRSRWKTTASRWWRLTACRPRTGALATARSSFATNAPWCVERRASVVQPVGE